MIETAVAVDEIFTTAGTMYIHEAFTDQNNITDINISAQTSDGKTAIDFARDKNNTAVVKLLEKQLISR